MQYKVRLTYFRPTGKLLTIAEASLEATSLTDLWGEVRELRRLARLPDLRHGSGRDLFVEVTVLDPPNQPPHLVVPPFVDEDDVTPTRIPTQEMVPLVRVHLAELPRTSTRDIVKIAPDDDEVTPVDLPLPRLPNEE